MTTRARMRENEQEKAPGSNEKMQFANCLLSFFMDAIKQMGKRGDRDNTSRQRQYKMESNQMSADICAVLFATHKKEKKTTTTINYAPSDWR